MNFITRILPLLAMFPVGCQIKTDQIVMEAHPDQVANAAYAPSFDAHCLEYGDWSKHSLCREVRK